MRGLSAIAGAAFGFFAVIGATGAKGALSPDWKRCVGGQG